MILWNPSPGQTLYAHWSRVFKVVFHGDVKSVYRLYAKEEGGYALEKWKEDPFSISTIKYNPSAGDKFPVPRAEPVKPGMVFSGLYDAQVIDPAIKYGKCRKSYPLFLKRVAGIAESICLPY